MLVIKHHLGLYGFALRNHAVQRSVRATCDFICQPPLSCCRTILTQVNNAAGRRGLAGQSACLVNRRSWVRFPAVPFNRWLCSVGSFWERKPLQILRFSNHIPIAERPTYLVLPAPQIPELNSTHWNSQEKKTPHVALWRNG